LKKVYFDARLVDNNQTMRNWKLVQECLRKDGITKQLPVQRIIEGRFQDNLECLQWFYRFFTEKNGESKVESYAGLEERKRSRGGTLFGSPAPFKLKKRRKIKSSLFQRRLILDRKSSKPKQSSTKRRTSSLNEFKSVSYSRSLSPDNRPCTFSAEEPENKAIAEKKLRLQNLNNEKQILRNQISFLKNKTSECQEYLKQIETLYQEQKHSEIGKKLRKLLYEAPTIETFEEFRKSDEVLQNKMTEIRNKILHPDPIVCGSVSESQKNELLDSCEPQSNCESPRTSNSYLTPCNDDLPSSRPSIENQHALKPPQAIYSNSSVAQNNQNSIPSRLSISIQASSRITVNANSTDISVESNLAEEKIKKLDSKLLSFLTLPENLKPRAESTANSDELLPLTNPAIQSAGSSRSLRSECSQSSDVVTRSLRKPKKRLMGLSKSASQLIQPKSTAKENIQSPSVTVPKNFSRIRKPSTFSLRKKLTTVKSANNLDD